MEFLESKDYKVLAEVDDALKNAKAAEEIKRDAYARADKLYDTTTLQWINVARRSLLKVITKK